MSLLTDLYLLGLYNACSLSNLIIYFNKFGKKKIKKNVIANENELWTKISDHGIRYLFRKHKTEVTP